MRRVGEKLLEVVARRVVEGEAGSSTELRVNVFELPLELAHGLKNLLLRRGKHAIETTQYGKRQNNILILAALKGIPDQIRNTPNETNYLAMVHG
jgi:hypothetical protein